jgi:hypothetical protein
MNWLSDMPTLTRLLIFLAVAAALIFGAMVVLATFVVPKQSEMTIRVPTDKLNPAEPKVTPAAP